MKKMNTQFLKLLCVLPLLLFAQLSNVALGQTITSCTVSGATKYTYTYSLDPQGFETDSDGWTKNGTTAAADRYNGGLPLGENYFLGRNSSGEYIQKTFTLNQKSHRISFDLYRLDSWDGEFFQVYVGTGSTLLFQKALVTSTGTFNESGTSGGYKYNISTTYTNMNIPYTGANAITSWYDQVIKVYIDVPAGVSTLTLKLSSTLDQADDDESWGIDNFAITPTQFDVPAGVTSVDVITVGGGGGGGSDGGSGGGGGGIRYGTINVGSISTLTAYPARGGYGAIWSISGALSGDASTIYNGTTKLYEALGGQPGGGWTTTTGGAGGTGGSGGTNLQGATGGGGPGTCLTTGSQGSAGSNGSLLTVGCSTQYLAGGGGGGQGVNGATATPFIGAAGGQGGGGRGANYRLAANGVTSITGSTSGFNGTSGTGGGGGGGSACDGGSVNLVNQRTNGGDGGSGAVIITYTALTASISSQTNLSCNGGANGSLTVTTTGGTANYNYAWSAGATSTSGSASASNTVTGLAAGTYTVTVTDANGNTTTASATVTQPTAVSASIASQVNVSCNGGSTGSATATSTGGTGTKTYLWSNAATGATATGLAAGSYTVTATDANGCTATSTATITQPTVVSASIASQVNVLCNGASTGSATASATGGTGTKTYVWSNGAAVATATGLAAGAYTVTATDANGCTSTASVTITQPVAASTTITSQTNVLCNGASTGAATASTTGGTSPYTFAWSNAATGATASGLAAGTYGVTSTDANGCTSTASVTITQPSAIVIPTLTSVTITCNGLSNGTLTAVPSGGVSPYTYAWSNASTGATATGLAVGTFTVTVTDANGCTQTKSKAMTQPTAVSASIASQVNVSCNGGANGSATATSTGGTGTKTYAWSNAATGATASGLAAGSYTVTATDANGCTSTATVTITQPAVLVSTASLTNNALCNGGASGAASSAATGGTTPYTYAWSNASTSATATGLAAGTYSVTITDANGCTDSSSVVIAQPVAASTTITSQTNVLCNGASTGAATASTTGGTSPYTFAWSNAATGATASGLAAGTYGVTSTDANGCTSTASVTITQPSAIVIPTLTSVTITCNGLSNGTLTAVPSGGVSPYTYAWSNASTGATATGLAVGTFTVTVTDANGCTQTKSKAMTQPTAVSASIASQVNVSCNGGANGSATAASTGGTGTVTYLWSNTATGATATGLAAGSYTVTATDANGCTSTATATITEPTVLVPTITSQTNVTCNGGAIGSATVSVTGGVSPYTYAWSNSSTGATATSLASGTYTMTATDANGCSSTITVIINEISSVVATISAQTNVSCNGGANGSATVSVTGGVTPYTYLWSTSSTTATESGLTAGAYIVSATDANGCTSINSVTITEPAALIASVTIDSNALCNGLSTGGATGTATGGTSPYTYSWSNAATTAAVTGLVAGTYSVTISDANGCTSTSTSTVTEPAVLTSVVAIDSNATCNGFANGGATATATGGTAPYAYAWSNASTSASITGIAAGTYTVTITDTNGCASTATDSVSEPMALMAMITLDSNVLCNGGADAGVTVMATGGTPGYAYTWNNASTVASITGLSAGVYEVTITDTNNCTTSVIDTIVEPTALAIMMNMDATVACFGTATGTASAMVSGGVAPYAYNWSNGDTAAMATGLNAATYMVMATDSNGCMIMDSIMIAGPASAMTVSVNETSGIVCAGDATGALEATANGGWGVYSFEWNTTATTASISGLTEGSYTVNVTDSLGCLETASESIVHQFELPVVNLGADTTICNDASIELNAGNDGAAYAWSTTESAQTIVVSDSGSYSVVVTDANGCAGSDEIVISLDDCTGINELGTELSLMVYPNPSRGVFQIESNGFNLNESTITIIDLVGNLVTTIRPQGAVRETITLNQSSGVYFLSIEVDGNVAQQRIIIQ